MTMRTMLSLSALLLLVAAAQPPALEHALYPNGLAPRHNEISNEDEVPDFLLLSAAALPRDREVVVWAERAGKDLKYDKLFFVYAGIVEHEGNEVRVLDRRDLTDDLPLTVETRGNAADVQALASVVKTDRDTVVAIELWSAISGSGGYSASNHLFFTAAEDGKLDPALRLELTNASGRDGNLQTAVVSTIHTIGTDISVERRKVRWPGSSPVAICDKPATTRYHLDGKTYVEGRSSTAATAPDQKLPRLSFEEDVPCAN